MINLPKRIGETIELPSRESLASGESLEPSARFSLGNSAEGAEFSPAVAVGATIEADSLPKAGTQDVIPASGPGAGKTDDMPQHTLDFKPPDPHATIDSENLEFSAGPAAPKPKTIKVPKHVAGYEILGVLGRGGMGVVYKARQPGLKRLVALKMILSGGHAGEHDLLRFRSEAEAVARLQHANIVQIYEVGEDEGRPYFSLEFVDGGTLTQELNGKPFAHRKAAEMLAVLAGAMAYAHEHGIIHRDLKPGNILIATDGTAKITDFGLAKRVEDEDNSQTRTGTILGTPDYMAPEQAAGDTKDVGPLADVYALGSMLYEFLTGRPPFRSASMLDTLQQVMRKEPVHPSQLDPKLPRDLETICLKCLHKEPEKRYAGAAALAEDLRRYLAGEPILARPVSPAERAWRWCRRNPRTTALSAAVALLIVVWAGTASWMAVRLNVEKDKTEDALGLAKENERLATQNAITAEEKAKEADWARGRAVENMKRARSNEVAAKSQHQRAADQMVALGGELQGLLQQKRGQELAGPELRALEDEILNLVQRKVVALAEDIDASGAIDYATVVTCQRLGNLLVRLGHGDQAMRQYEQGYRLAKQLADARPDDDTAHANLGLMRLEMGKMIRELSDDAQLAREYFLEGRELQEQVRTHPHKNHPFKSHDHHRLLSFYERETGECDLRLGRPAAAREHFQAALAHRLAWVAEQPGNTDAVNLLAEAYHWMGVVAWHLSDSPAVDENFGQGLKIINAMIQQSPGEWDYQGDLADIEGALGDAQWRLGLRDKARDSYEKSLEHVSLAVERLGKDHPAYIARRALLATAHERLGAIDRAEQRAAAADADYRMALAIRAELSVFDPTNLAWQAAYALTLAHCGQSADAVKKAEDVSRRASHGRALLLQTACCYAACAASATEAQERRQYTERAIDALRTVAGDDFQDLMAIKTNPDLVSLESEPDYQTLLSELDSRSNVAVE
ncbi:MAG TPA: serine/threonine-protein kinase [Pirellulales bacterium]|nr:serine/threonine-protein kinase [Pirellulales bacterium]